MPDGSQPARLALLGQLTSGGFVVSDRSDDESTANIAQPSANPHKSSPVTSLTFAGMNGAATRSRPQKAR
jgi:hypothetical protein